MGDALHAATAADDAASLSAWFAAAGIPGRVTVALSGGVDSAVVLAAAAYALGPSRVLAATAVSPALPSGMLDVATDLAARLGTEHRQVPTDEMDVEGYARNGHDRCFFCKATLVETLDALRTASSGPVLTGTNADDVGDYRPGIRAAAERGARTPLADTGLGKARVRAVARAWGLPVWDRPASPCLSSRVAYGIRITPARLARIDQAEVAVRARLDAAGVAVRDLRVRDLGEAVRVELDAAALTSLRGHGSPERLLDDVREAVRASGFDTEPEVRAFASGALNAALPASLRSA